MGLAPWLDGFADRPLVVTVVRKIDEPSATTIRWELLLQDPLVGTFPALLLLPRGPGPHRGVVGLPGHSDSAWDFADRQFGHVLAERGTAVLALMTRANASDSWEDFLTRSLWTAGSSLMAARTYEAMVGLKVLQSRPEIDPARIALMGHSGGSVTAHLAARTGAFAAAIVDLQSTYNGRMEPDLLLDEVHPDLFVLHPWINEVSAFGKPVLLEPYGYPRGPGPVLEFLRSSLP